MGQGSSPLARGLPDSHRERGNEVRIIPARAGFTISTPTARRPMRDHPRSRGVYGPVSSRANTARGSSPLARGLHILEESAARQRGIIPARAGFTTETGTRPMGKRRVGSSPLARGLPRRGGPFGPGARIIPARAGFTPRSRASPTAVKDHPRSRGVYGTDFGGTVNAWGSSPLARGLRHAVDVPPSRRRIIPARAGFTA